MALRFICFNPSLHVFRGYVVFSLALFCLLSLAHSALAQTSNIALQQARITIKPVFLPLKRSYLYTSWCLNALEDLNVMNKDARRSWVSQLSYNNCGEEMTLETMDKGEQRFCAYVLHKLCFYTFMGFKKNTIRNLNVSKHL